MHMQAEQLHARALCHRVPPRCRSPWDTVSLDAGSSLEMAECTAMGNRARAPSLPLAGNQHFLALIRSLGGLKNKAAWKPGNTGNRHGYPWDMYRICNRQFVQASCTGSRHQR